MANNLVALRDALKKLDAAELFAVVPAKPGQPPREIYIDVATLLATLEAILALPPAPAPLPRRVQVIKSSVNIRKSPSIAASVNGQLSRWQIVEVAGPAAKGWYQLADGRGFVLANLVQTVVK